MKIYLIFLVVILPNCFGMPTDPNITAHLTKIKTVFLEAIKDKCYQNSTENYQHFTILLDNFTNCLTITAEESPIFVTPLKTFKDNIQSCANDVIEELEECLPEETNEWPQLNMDTVFSIFDFLYENREELFSPKIINFIQTCMETSHKPEVQSKYLECMNFFNPGTLDWKMSCQELIQWEKCFMAQINKECPGDEAVEKLKVDFLEALNIACVEYELTDNPVDSMFTLLAPYAPPNLNPDLM